MRFRRFRIKNYRSLIDTGWNDLAIDNITGIIGQNESGKTSILEALNSFYTGIINDDILRSDLSLPVVYCAFETNLKQITKLLGDKKIPEQVIESIEDTGLVTLGRAWENEKKSYLFFGDERLSIYFQKQLRDKQEFEKKVEEDILRLIDEANKANDEYQQAMKEKNDEQKHVSSLEAKEPKIQRAFDRAPDKENSNRLEKFMIELDRSKKHLEKKNKIYEAKLARATELAEKARYSHWCLSSVKEFKKSLEICENSLHELNEEQIRYENLVGIRQKRRAWKRLDILENRYKENLARMKKAKFQESARKNVVARILKGMNPTEAEEQVEKENTRLFAYYTERELAGEIFKHIPVFQMFEDFSSLLPNRIDIDDVFAAKSHAEGYKAARNFLTIANLDESFFDVRNNRILKQKIEKLNNEITLNFHEYWHQDLGNQNKIRINFELEHYDDTHPDKMGKPYIEFWIVDNQERLYPKQRSRGVRWFLSFYLELKASAVINKGKSRVILIDEPGLSLHARAQEDVLKVLEDVKEDIQVIYSTHSPHLIDMNKLYRLLAVQRAVESDLKSGSIIFDAKSLNEASADTLSPIYANMGTKAGDYQLIKKKNNIVVEDLSTYHYLKTIFSLIELHKEFCLLPASDVLNVPVLVNLLLGWNLNFIILLDDDDNGNHVYNDIKSSLFHDDDKLAIRKIIKMDNKAGIEELFSPADFKNFILHKRVNLAGSNLEYIEKAGLSRNILASNFVLHVQNNNIRFIDFDEETKENFSILVQSLDRLLE
jgi:predicted ATP-dependent endonuclease of OLD family